VEGEVEAERFLLRKIGEGKKVDHGGALRQRGRGGSEKLISISRWGGGGVGGGATTSCPE